MTPTATNCSTFCELILKDNCGRSLRNAELHDSWHTHIEYCWNTLRKHPVIFAPWGHGKTIQIVIGRILWELAAQPDLRVKVVCNARRAAKNRIQMLKQYIELDDDLHELFPVMTRPSRKLQLPWTQHAITIECSPEARKIDPSVQAEGILTSGIGSRADLIVFDDVVDRRNALDNPRLLEKVKDNFFETWLSRLDGIEGRSLTIMTLWHKDDLGHSLMRNTEFCVLKQAISDDLTQINCELYNHDKRHPLLINSNEAQIALPLWEEHWPSFQLQKKKNENPRAFARGFQQKAFTNEDMLFPSFKQCFLNATIQQLLNI